eukprot:TRINITY_DN2008_c0_g1_i2.p1 TRINITY_DN2008_c0_g1~~TRINITY_DN2008_c0_g1_i2.p1  ORF type:complete len:204 (-),score=31.44 TRINITY_DN2008_c0_g1_i2:510-1121(-)
MAEHWDGKISSVALGKPLYSLLLPPLLLAVRAWLCRREFIPESWCGYQFLQHLNLFHEDPVAFGFVIAAIVNFMILIPSDMLTNDKMAAAWPSLFGRPGCVQSIMWGLAYLAASRRYATVPWLIMVFALQKLYLASAGYAHARVNSKSRFDQALVRHFEIATPREVQPQGFGLVEGALCLFFCWAGYCSLFNCVKTTVVVCDS